MARTKATLKSPKKTQKEEKITPRRNPRREPEAKLHSVSKSGRLSVDSVVLLPVVSPFSACSVSWS